VIQDNHQGMGYLGHLDLDIIKIPNEEQEKEGEQQKFDAGMNLDSLCLGF
jgi:hypothetical protein